MTPSAIGKSPNGISIRSWAIDLLVSSWTRTSAATEFCSATGHNFERQAFSVEPQAFRAVGKQHRLARLEPEQRVRSRLLAGELFERSIIVDDAVLIDLDEARAPV